MGLAAEVWPDPVPSFAELFGPRLVADVPAPPLPDYAEGLFRPMRYKVLYGGRGAGRSWSVARVLLTEGARRPIRVLCARELQRSIKDSVHRLLCDQIDLLGLPYEITQNEIRHPNGTLFIFEGLRYNATKIKSMEGVDRCWVEEAERVSAASWAFLLPTIRKAGSEIWVTFNPDQEGDPTYRDFVLNPRPDAWVLKVSAEDNPWLPDELKAEREYLYRVDPDAAAHVWGGECRHASDAQILKGKWTVDAFEGGGRLWDGPYHGMDFGYANDPTAVVRCWIHERKLYVEHEAYKIGLDLHHTTEFVKRNVPDCNRYTIRADDSRPDTIAFLKAHGLPQIIGAPKGKGSVEDGIAHLRQYEQIVIHPRCKHTIEEARLYSYKTDARTGDVLPDVQDKHNHCIDSIRYALQPLIKKRGSLAGVTSLGSEALAGPSQWDVTGEGLGGSMGLPQSMRSHKAGPTLGSDDLWQPGAFSL